MDMFYYINHFDITTRTAHYITISKTTTNITPKRIYKNYNRDLKKISNPTFIS